jgi:uncharacterized RDD family membrane protein YckC
MMYDSVREELAAKISPLSKSSKPEITSETRVEISKPLVAPLAPPQNFMPPLPPVKNSAPPMRNSAPLAPPIEQTPPAPKTIEKIETSEITAKPTSPTLVEFRHKNAALPEWRLQLKNAVRKRSGNEEIEDVSPQAYAPVPRPLPPTQGATALKIEPTVQENPAAASNPKLAAALRRIEQSRQQFYAEEKPKLTIVPAPLAPEKDYPFTVVNPSDELPAPEEITPGKFESKTFPIQPQTAKFDTNKLPPISEIVAANEAANNRPANVAVLKAKPLGETADAQAYGVTEVEEEHEEFDDCPPFSLRFNAGLFDLIIGGFASFVLLSPFVIVNGNLFSFEGFFAFLATAAIVMFVYLTTSIAFFGRTLGMRLFSLEIIDVEENDYPTFHQAAVNSVVYLFSLALGGLGFLPALFNDERRAAHDLAAGTIVVKEF